jgi:hypothetical protein
MGHWKIESAGWKRKISGKNLKAAIKESFKKKPPKFLSRLLKITDLETKMESYLSPDAVVKVK